jgi:Uma2 family endonuclease
MEKILTLEPVSVEAYLEREKTAEVKHEYVEGMLFEMSGSSSRHNRLALNLVVQLWQPAEAMGCRVYASDMKLRAAERVFYYPDVMVVCDEEPDPFYQDKPCLVIEVLSPSTEATDRREKLLAYQKLPTLQGYLLVDAETPRIESYTRHEGSWQYRLCEGEGTLELPCPQATLRLGDIYRGL